MITLQGTIDGAAMLAHDAGQPLFVAEHIRNPRGLGLRSLDGGVVMPATTPWDGDDGGYAVRFWHICAMTTEESAAIDAAIAAGEIDPDGDALDFDDDGGAALTMYLFSGNRDLAADPTMHGAEWVTTGAIMARDLLRAPTPPGHLHVIYAAWPDGTVATIHDIWPRLRLLRRVS